MDELKEETNASVVVGGGDNSKSAKDEGNPSKSNGERKYNHTPPEELFDLTKPIKPVTKPSKEEHEADLAKCEGEIEKLRAQKDEIQKKIDNMMKSGKNSEAGKEREAFQMLKRKKGQLIDEKKAIRERLNKIRAQSDKMFEDQKSAKAGIKFSNVEDIDNEIRKLQRRQETVSMSLAEEKKIIQEITKLQLSKSSLAQLKTKELSIADVKEQKKLINEELKAKDKEIDAVQAEIKTKTESLDALKSEQNESRQQSKALMDERDELREQISFQIKEKNLLRQEFREKNNSWYDYKRAIAAQKKMKYEEEKKKREEERQEWLRKKEEEEMKKIPYEEEMALCDYLVEYLTKTYLQDGKEEKEKSQADFVKVVDDPFAGMVPKKRNEDEVFLQMGKGKKLRKKTKKAKKTTFTLNVDFFEQFGFLSLTPPTSLEMVEPSVNELKEKKKWYSEQPRGSVPTAADIRRAKEKSISQPKKSQKGADAPQSTSTRGGKGGKFSLAEDDFVPLGGNSGRVVVNSTWGQKSDEPEAIDGGDVVDELATAAAAEEE